MSNRYLTRFLAGCCAVPWLACSGFAAEIGGANKITINDLQPADRKAEPEIAPASGEAEAIIKRFKIPAGFKVEVFAAEPMLANPVAFAIDEKMRFYVAETHRYRSSVLDIRSYMPWLEDDLASRTVEDREKMVRKYLGAKAEQLGIETELIRFIEDRDGDGKADFSSVFATGFNTLNDGIASGVMARKGKVWFANIPELWLLDGPNAEGKATSRRSAAHGFGVHFSLTGHDLHGLKFGPDGRVYFTVGDRGAYVRTAEGKVLDYPDEGVCFRMNPDGTDLQVFATGLRNPQELAFDEHGNLFTADNDSDMGDRERWIHIVEGGDSGWRIGYQNNPLGNAGPWNMEKLWVPQFEGQAAYLLPPLGNLNDGPSGLVYYPGTGLPKSYNGHFFLCYFKGSSARSGIDHFSIKPRGASFELVKPQEFIGDVLPTDVDFGYDGAIYFTDWNQGWEKSKKGRIYRIYNPETRQQPIVNEVRKIMAEGMEQRSLDQLSTWLAHQDMRIRQEAQFELADRATKELRGRREGASGPTPPALTTLQTVLARSSNAPLARLHALWGIGQVARRAPTLAQPLVQYLEDSDLEIQAHAAQILGEMRQASALPGLIQLVGSSKPRLQLYALMALGKLQKPEAIPAVLNAIRQNSGNDPYLRHAGVMALIGINDTAAIQRAAGDDSPAVRMAAVLAMRRQGNPDIAKFLNDANLHVAEEAARAINDAPINAAMPTLARYAGNEKFTGERAKSEPLAMRVVNANFRVGQKENAEHLAKLAARSDVVETARIEALRDLAMWAQPPARDRLVGIWRPVLPARDADVALKALEPVLGKLLSGGSAEVRATAAKVAGDLKIRGAGESLLALVRDNAAPVTARLEALRALGRLETSHLSNAVAAASQSKEDQLRREANRLSAQLTPGGSVGRLVGVIGKGSIAEQQGAVSALGESPQAEADAVLAGLVDRLAQGKLAPEIALEVLQAAGRRTNAAVQARLEAYQAGLPKDKPLARYNDLLRGGNVESGRKIFHEKPEASCIRCHKVGDEGGEAGPVLNGMASRHPREYLLEAIMLPNAAIAPGFESVLVELKNGMSYAGILKREDADIIEVNSPEDGLLKLKKSDIKSREKGLSAMPEGLDQALSRQDLRDLVEYLSSLK